jgi:murein L,D-transpeptidase YafK
MKNLIKLFLVSTLINLNFANAADYKVDEVRVYKTRHRMEMLYDGKITKVYTIMLGRGGLGPKRQEGDKKVPEGKYVLDFKNPYSKFFRSIHISYPNADDIERAKLLGVNPGGDIFLHGMPNYFSELESILSKEALNIAFPYIDWTAGCVAVLNNEMQEIWDNVEVPTPITIFH